MKLPHSLSKHSQQFFLSFNANDSHWHKIKKGFDVLFSYEQMEVRNSHNVRNRKATPMLFFSLLKDDFLTVMDLQAITRSEWEVIAEHIGVNDTSYDMCKEGIWA